MWSSYAMNYNNSASIGMCHATTASKLFGTYILNRTIQDYLVEGSFTKNPKENVVHIPNPDLQLCQGVGRRKKRIRNNMDEAEAGPAVVMCYKCLNMGHTYKRCPTTSYACNGPPTVNVGSSATPGPSQPPSGRGHGRGRGRRTNAGSDDHSFL
jgi:hypothetical protein